MWQRGPTIPDEAEFGVVVIRELRSRGGIAGVSELQIAMRDILAAQSETNAAWERAFVNMFQWTMRMLRELNEVVRWPPSEPHPSGWYEALPIEPSTSESELARRRREWLDEVVQGIKDRWAEGD